VADCSRSGLTIPEVPTLRARRTGNVTKPRSTPFPRPPVWWRLSNTGPGVTPPSQRGRRPKPCTLRRRKHDPRSLQYQLAWQTSAGVCRGRRSLRRRGWGSVRARQPVGRMCPCGALVTSRDQPGRAAQDRLWPVPQIVGERSLLAQGGPPLRRLRSTEMPAPGRATPMIRTEGATKLAWWSPWAQRLYPMTNSKPRVGVSLDCLPGTSFACPRTAQTRLQRHVKTRGDDSFGVDSAKCRVSQGHGF